MRPQRASQEFYCGECVGYFLVRLNMALNHEVEVRCPNCGHEHRRVVRDGVIYESGRFASSVKEKVLTTIATYHKEPITEHMQNAHAWDRRDAVKISADQKSRWSEMLRWSEVAAREQTGEMFDDDN